MEALNWAPEVIVLGSYATLLEKGSKSAIFGR